MATEAQKRKAREEFDRRKRNAHDSTVTAGTSFEAWWPAFIAAETPYTTTDSSSSSSYDSGSSSSYDSGSSSSYDSGSSSSSDGGSSFSDGGGGGSW